MPADLHKPSSTRAGAPTGRVTGGSKVAVKPQREVRAEGASFLAGGVSPHFDVAMSCTFYKTPRAHAVFSPLGASCCRASNRPIPRLAVKFFFTKIPLPSEPTVTERACGRRPCRVLTSCVQLVASHFQGEQPDPGASKITVYRLRSRNPPAYRTLRRPSRTAGQIIFRMKELGKTSQRSVASVVASDQVSLIEIDDSSAGQHATPVCRPVSFCCGCSGFPRPA